MREWESLSYKAKKSREWRARNPEKSRQLALVSYKKRRETPEGWLRHVLTTVKRRAFKAGVVFSVNAADFSIPEKCPILGVVLVYGSTLNAQESASIDRIKPWLGYITGNVRIVSRLANRLKGDCTDPAIFRALVADAERHL